MQVEQLKKNVAKLKKQSQDGQVKVMFTKMRNLQKQIDINDKRYNQITGDIEKLKKQINALRQEKFMYKNNLKSLQDDIEKADYEITHLMSNIQESQSNSKMSQNLMLSLKMKNQEDKNNYYKRLNELNKQLKDPKLNRASRIKTGQIQAIQNDTATILKNILTKLILNNKQKVKLIDNYQRNMKVIDQTFNTIKQATGLTDIKEIQNTFIKGEEQNYNLLTYVDVLNQQIDALVDNNQTLRLKNQALKNENVEKKKILSGTSDDQKRKIQIQEYIDSRKKNISTALALKNITQLVNYGIIQLAIQLGSSALIGLNTSLIIFKLNYFLIIYFQDISCYHKSMSQVYMDCSFFKADFQVKQKQPKHQLLLFLNLYNLLMVNIILLKIILDHFEQLINLKVQVSQSLLKCFIGIMQQIALFNQAFNQLNFEYIQIENISLFLLCLRQIDLLKFIRTFVHNYYTNILRIIYFSSFQYNQILRVFEYNNSFYKIKNLNNWPNYKINKVILKIMDYNFSKKNTYFHSRTAMQQTKIQLEENNSVSDSNSPFYGKLHKHSKILSDHRNRHNIELQSQIEHIIKNKSCPNNYCKLYEKDEKLESQKIKFINFRIDRIEGEVKEIKTQVTELKTQVTELKTQVTELKTQVTELKTQVTEVKTQVKELKTQVTELKTQVTEVKTQVKELKTQVIIIKTQICQIKEKMNSMEGRMNSIDQNLLQIMKMLEENKNKND